MFRLVTGSGIISVGSVGFFFLPKLLQKYIAYCSPFCFAVCISFELIKNDLSLPDLPFTSINKVCTNDDVFFENDSMSYPLFAKS